MGHVQRETARGIPVGFVTNPAVLLPGLVLVMAESRGTPLPLAWQRHERHWRQNAYCYPVVSRRSGGLSVGINLNPDKACNFDCVYCQVERRTPAAVRRVDLDRVRSELMALVDVAVDRSLFSEAPFDAIGPDDRRVRDFAFSGDGEPTTCPKFAEAVELAAEVRRVRGLEDTKLVLITDACYLTRPEVRRGLGVLDANNGEVWAKLDAGTEPYYRAVNRPNYPLSHVLENLLDASRGRPIVIQSLWMRLHGEAPPDGEVEAFAGRLNDLLSAGGQIQRVQVYTIARQTAEPYAAALSRAELDRIAQVIAESAAVPIEQYDSGVA
ncbi:MAG: radical SAM protein [Phycisphaerae bacterium]